MKDLDVAIIGAGPAGLTAGIYTGRARLKTVVFESYRQVSQAGLTDRIDNYPGFPEGISGYELIDRFRSQVRRFGVEFIPEEVTGVEKEERFIIKTEKGEYPALAVIIAAGAIPKRLGVPGEEEFIGRGVSYCATCDAPFFRNKQVAVVGGGNTAVQEAIYLTRFAQKVTVIHRRNRLRAIRCLQEEAFSNPKIDLLWDSVVTEIRGDGGGVRSILINDVVKGGVKEVPVDGVFIFVGYSPNTGFLKGLLNLDDTGYIQTDMEMKTGVDGIFACGDCRKGALKQIVTACGDGAVAANSARLYIERLKGTVYE